MRGVGPFAARGPTGGFRCILRGFVSSACVPVCLCGLSGRFSQATPYVCTALLSLSRGLPVRCRSDWEVVCAGVARDAAMQDGHKQEAESSLAVVHELAEPSSAVGSVNTACHST